MRQSYGIAFITTLIIILTFLFSGYIAVSIKYSKAFKAKNEVISIIEKFNGINSRSEEIIDNYLKSIGHDSVGACPDGWEGHGLQRGSKRGYCVKRNLSVRNTENYYYSVKLFFQFGLPIIDDIATFDVEGETVDLKI